MLPNSRPPTFTIVGWQSMLKITPYYGWSTSHFFVITTIHDAVIKAQAHVCVQLHQSVQNWCEYSSEDVWRGGEAERQDVEHVKFLRAKAKNLWQSVWRPPRGFRSKRLTLFSRIRSHRRLFKSHFFSKKKNSNTTSPTLAQTFSMRKNRNVTRACSPT